MNKLLFIGDNAVAINQVWINDPWITDLGISEVRGAPRLMDTGVLAADEAGHRGCEFAPEEGTMPKNGFTLPF